MHHVKPGPLHTKQLLHLVRREFGNGDDGIRRGGGLPRLLGETAAEFRSGIIASEHEQIVKSRNRLPEPDAGKPLV